MGKHSSHEIFSMFQAPQLLSSAASIDSPQKKKGSETTFDSGEKSKFSPHNPV